jgi:hypothetical protein
MGALSAAGVCELACGSIAANGRNTVNDVNVRKKRHCCIEVVDLPRACEITRLSDLMLGQRQR